MERKSSIRKSIAALLCIVTMVIAFNIYLSYQDIYVSDNLPRDSIIYIASAKTPINDSVVSPTNMKFPSRKSEEISKSTSIVNLNKEDFHNKIFINIFMLLLSFITLASVHNYVLNVEKTKVCNSMNTQGLSLNKKTSIKSASSIVPRAGVK